MKISDKSKPTRQKSKSKQSSNSKKYLKAISVSVFIGAVLTCLLMLGVSLLMSKIDFAQSLVVPAATLCFCAGGFASGYVCSIINKQNGFFMGIVCGFILFTLGVLSAIMIMPLELPEDAAELKRKAQVCGLTETAAIRITS